MKVTKDLLKTVVKECLIEILSEGFNVSQDKNHNNMTSAISESKKKPRKKASDFIKFENTVRETSRNLTSDPILGAIFEDTAKTTLQEQFNSPDSLVAGDRASYAAATSDPTDLFAESAGKWANLAFSDFKE